MLFEWFDSSIAHNVAGRCISKLRRSTCEVCSYVQYGWPSLVSWPASSMVFSDTLCPVVTLAVDLHATAMLLNNQQGSPAKWTIPQHGTTHSQSKELVCTKLIGGSPILQHCVGDLPGRPILEGLRCQLARGRADLRPSCNS